MSTPLPPITVSRLDLARLEALLDTPAVRNLPIAEALGVELERAQVVEPDALPPNVVALNSTVTCLDESSGETHTVTLVWPNEADASAGKVSVLAPIGAALLGLSVGQSINWPAPGGRTLRVRVESVAPRAA